LDAGGFVNPTGGGIRGCDSQGCGEFGAPRDGYAHPGADYVGTPGQSVVAVQGGTVTKVGYPYGDDLSYRYVEISGGDGIRSRQFYVNPAAGISRGAFVTAGQSIGTLQALGPRYPGITEHSHTEIHNDGRLINPATVIPNPPIP